MVGRLLKEAEVAELLGIAPAVKPRRRYSARRAGRARLWFSFPGELRDRMPSELRACSTRISCSSRFRRRRCLR